MNFLNISISLFYIVSKHLEKILFIQNVLQSLFFNLFFQLYFSICL